MSNIGNGIPVTPVYDPATVATATIANGTIAATGIGGGPLQVFVQGGTIGASFSFIGSVTTDIGNVKIEDADDNYAVIPPAQDAKTGATKALVVQHIDDTGTPLRESTQVAIRVSGSNTNETLANIDLNTMAATVYLAEIANMQGTQSTATLLTIANQQGTLATSANQTAELVELHAIHNNTGTLATSALQVAGNNVLVAILNAQGTQSSAGLATSALQSNIVNNQGTQATSALQTAGNQTLVTILNNQGTQATSALQTAGNSVLVAIMNNQGTQGATSSSSAAETVIMNNQGTQATSALQQTAVINGSLSNDLLRQLVTLSGTIPPSAYTLLSAATGAGASAAYDISWASDIAVQHVIANGTASIEIRTSLDGVNWFTEKTSTASEMLMLKGPTKYISANYVSGSGTVTTRILASAGGGGGVAVSSSGTTNQFGAFSTALSQTLGATYEVSVDGYNGIGLHIKPPTGGSIQFEGSYDGVNWTPITLRQLGDNGYTQHTETESDFIGSIACLTKIRFKTILAGSAPGSVGGRMTVPTNTLEGIEHGYAPHNIGYNVIAKEITFTGSQFNYPLWVPAPSKRAVISDIHFSIDTTATIQITDGPVANNDPLFKAIIKVPGGDSRFISLAFSLPHVTHQNGTVYYSQSATSNVDGVIQGYEIDI
jgi:hypothetical protein